MATVRLEEHLDHYAIPANALSEVLDENRLRCVACAHRCLIKPGRRGICRVRFNTDGQLNVPYGYVGALQVDPIEKKPFWHVLPGARALSYGMLGCNLHCSYCQNWDISQTLRDSNAGRDPMPMTADDLIALARRHGAQTIASTYNEPLITSEWSRTVFEKAQDAGLYTLYVSSGNATQEVIDYLKPVLTGYKVDLKSMRDKPYRSLGTVLEHVLDTIRMIYEAGIWLEVLTLVVPGFNDSTEELWDTAQFIRGLSPSIPWHVTAFHPDYKMLDVPRTTVDTLQRAAEIGLEAGLHYVYAGNIPGRVGSYEDTRCPKCQSTVIKRLGYRILQNRLQQGTCPDCATAIPGVWN